MFRGISNNFVDFLQLIFLVVFLVLSSTITEVNVNAFLKTVVWSNHRMLKTSFVHSIIRVHSRRFLHKRSSHIPSSSSAVSDGISGVLINEADRLSLNKLRGTPEVADYLQSLAGRIPGIESHIDLYRLLYPFKLDDFQLESLKSFINGNNVLLTTPTGSGKTLVSELAIYHSIMKGMRLIYTTPLKALSNQKYFEFCKKFGGDRVSLTTGDIMINRGAPITVMTTEIFRNQLYSKGRPNYENFDLKSQNSILDTTNKLHNHYMVVFDEFHYLNDDERGTVWEESIISCPSNVRILALSATIGNAEVIADWIADCHGPTQWIHTMRRPVPLKYFFALKDMTIPFFSDPMAGPGARNSANLENLKRNSHPGWKLNPLIKKLEQSSTQPAKKRNKRVNKRDNHLSLRELSSRLCPKYTEVVRRLNEKDKLPAIFFIFSRYQCEQAASYIYSSDISLLDESEMHEINLSLKTFIEMNPQLPISRMAIKMLHAGVAVHHAGLLPIWKLFIEELFAANKIKVIFATETLAAGVNMPARTTVITAVSRKKKGILSHIRTSDLLQMAGRAGRRGIDSEGNVVFMRHEKEHPEIPHRLLIGNIEDIQSKFKASYSVASKMLTVHSLGECKQLVDKSLGSFVAQRATSLQARSKLKDQNTPFDSSDLLYNDQKSEVYRNIIRKYSLSKCSSYARLVKRIQSKEDALSQVTSQSLLSFDTDLSALSDDDKLLKQRLSDMKDSLLKLNITTNGDSALVCEAMSFVRRLDNIKEFLEKGKIHMKSSVKNSTKGVENTSWLNFMNVLGILQHFGAVDQDYQPTSLGHVVSSISTENELWVAMILQSPLLHSLDHHQLGALLASVQIDEFRVANCVFQLEASPQLQNVTDSLAPLSEELILIQENCNIDFPVSLSKEICGVAEAWSRGMPWHHICATTSMDQGDLHRVFKKTSDLLRELSNLPGLHSSIAANAYAAAASFGRYPVSNHEYDIGTGATDVNADAENSKVDLVEQEPKQRAETVLNDTEGNMLLAAEVPFQSEKIFFDGASGDFLIGDANTDDELEKYLSHILELSTDKISAMSKLNLRKSHGRNKWRNYRGDVSI